MGGRKLFEWAFDNATGIGQRAGRAAYDLWGEPDEATNSAFDAARNFTPRRDPLVLDLDGDGLELKPASSNLLFDHDADGIRTATGWAGADDGFLVRDLDGNGLIDSGRELFGEDTVKRNGQHAADGFDALADLDSNGDGEVTSADAAWAELQVWRDLNQDGISQRDELSALDALNITRIGTHGSTTGPQAGKTLHNNLVARSTTFIRTGAEHTVGAIDLDANPFFSHIPAEQVDESGQSVTFTEAALALPQMNGSGMVRNLRAAMSQAGSEADELRASVEALSAATTRDTQLAQLDAVITAWAQTSSYWSDLETTLGGPVALTPPEGMNQTEYRRLIAVLEAFNGSRFYGASGQPIPAGQTTHTVNGVTTHTIRPPADQVELLQQAYAALKDSVYAAVAVQTRLRPYLESIELAVSENGVSFDTAGLHQLLQQRYDNSARHGVEDLIELGRFASTSMQAVDFPVTSLLREWSNSWPIDSPLRALLVTLDVFTPEATAGSERGDFYLGDARNNTFEGEDGDDVLDGGDGDDTLSGGNGNDVLLGGAGNDTLVTSAHFKARNAGAVDVLDGETGDDLLLGGFGSQTYRFGRGDGQDWINNAADNANPLPDTTLGKQDVLEFKAGIAASDVSLHRSGDDLVARIQGSTDQVTVFRYFAMDGASLQGYALDAIRFVDGTSWGVAQVKAMVLQGTEGEDVITGYGTSDVLAGGAGEDTLYGSAGDDTLEGGDGNDSLFGGEGSDLLMGGAGDDMLFAANVLGGGHADATDVLDGGAGNDYLRGALGSQTYLFGRSDGQDTIVNFPAPGSDLADPTPGKCDVLQFKAGVSASDVTLKRERDNLIVQIKGSTDQVTVAGHFHTEDAPSPGHAIDAIRFADGTSWNAEQITALARQGTEQNDTITGSTVGDTLDGGAGDDRLDGREGDDVLIGGLGDDVLHGSSGDDTLQGGGGNDTLFGGAGSDALRGGAGDDVLYAFNAVGSGQPGAVDLLDGGTGNDRLVGDFGSQTYVFGRGDGQDTIENLPPGWRTWTDPTAGKQDTLQFKAGISASDVALNRQGDDLIVALKGRADQITIVNHFGMLGDPAPGYALDAIRFDDGTVWSTEQIATLIRQGAGGTDGDDMLHAQPGNRLLDGGAGNDRLYGDSGDDILLGGDGDDTLWGNGGNDVLNGGAGQDALFADEPSDGTSPGAVSVLDGGAGDDHLQGGWGSQTYMFGRGDGQDFLWNQSVQTGGRADPSVGKQDVLQFKPGIAASDVSLSRLENHLLVQLKGSDDQMAVMNYFVLDSTSRPAYALDAIRFDDGTSWDYAYVHNATTTTSAATTEASQTRDAIASSPASMPMPLPLLPPTEAQRINAMADAFMQTMAGLAPPSAQTSFVPLPSSVLAPVLAPNVV